MNDKRKEKYKSGFVEQGFMEPDDNIVDYIQGNYFERRLGNLGKWQQGWICFTERKIIFPTAILSFNEDIIIPYENIRELDKCNQGLFPMGIVVVYEHPKTGERTEQRFSVSKRDRWIAFLKEKAHLS